MAALATREPAALRSGSGSAEPRLAAEPRATRLFEPQEPTLEDSVLALWDVLVTDGRADCPVCCAAMSASAGCSECGSELS
jgi:hypothetical protein